jgi:hypothetical protein
VLGDVVVGESQPRRAVSGSFLWRCYCPCQAFATFRFCFRFVTGVLASGVELKRHYLLRIWHGGRAVVDSAAFKSRRCDSLPDTPMVAFTLRIAVESETPAFPVSDLAPTRGQHVSENDRSPRWMPER